MDLLKHYNKLIEKYRKRNNPEWEGFPDGTLYNNHHIIPRHVDENSTETVPVTLREHAHLHWCRWKLYNDTGDMNAYCLMYHNTPPHLMPPDSKEYSDWYKALCNGLPQCRDSYSEEYKTWYNNNALVTGNKSCMMDEDSEEYKYWYASLKKRPQSQQPGDPGYDSWYKNMCEASNSFKKKTRCIETNQIFESASAANYWLQENNIRCGSVALACRTGCRCGGYHWEYILSE